MARRTTLTAPEYQSRLTERAWRGLVRDAAETLHWRVLFELPDKAYVLLADEARRNPGQGHLLPPEGWPDFVFGREKDEIVRVINVELKTNKGSPSPAQVETLDLLAGAQHETYLWRPRDWDEVIEVLT